MVRYVLHLGVPLGMTVLLAGGFAALSACYRVPTPVCGFRCGPNGECPADYACSSFEDRCHLTGSDPTFRCDTTDDTPDDAPPDQPIDAIDAPVDTVGNDGGTDGGTDAAVDAPTD